MYFVGNQRSILQIFFIFEFIFILFSYLVVGFACFIICSVPQFHRNINGFLCNIVFSYWVLEMARMAQIGMCGFDAEIDFIQYKTNTTISSIYRYLDDSRQICLNSYVLTYFSIAIERTIASVKLKNYEKFENTFILIGVIIFQWIIGYIGFLIYLYGPFEQELCEILSVSFTVICFLWIVVLHFVNLHRYNNRTSRVYDLKERFQLSENIRFLRMLLWCSITALLGGIFTLIIYFLPYNNTLFESYIFNSIYLNSFVLIAILVLSVAVFTNPIWKRKFTSILKTVRSRVSPWLDQEETNLHNVRFHAPHIKSINGKEMVFSEDMERELYFQYLKERF